MERPKIVNKIVYDGDRGLAVTYKKAALRLLESCRLHASFNRLGVYSMSRKMDDGTVIEAQVIGGVPTVKVTSPRVPVRKPENEWTNPTLVVVVGNEQVGYKVALVPTTETLTPKVRKYDTMREIMRMLPPVRQRELFVRRYAAKTDLRAYDVGEPLNDLYVVDGEIHFFPDEVEIDGPRCNPPTEGHCPYSPVNPDIVTCHSEVNGSTPLLEPLLPSDIEHTVELGFTARAWCYRREGDSSYWAEKREVTYAASAATNRLSFNLDVVRRRGYSTAEVYAGDCLMNHGLLVTERWKCTEEWQDTSATPYEQYGLAAVVELIVERIETPVGRAYVLGDKAPTLDAIHGVYNSDPDQFTMGKSEPFTYPIDSEIYRAIVKEKDDCRADPALPLGMYAYTDPAFFYSWGVEYRGQFLCPLTKYVTPGLGTPGLVKVYMDGGVGTGPTYNNMALKGFSLAVEHDTGETQVYFRNFLEGHFIFNGHVEPLGIFEKVSVRQISIGRSSHKTLALVENLRRVFEFFRADDLAEGLLTADDPEPVKGTVMAYLFDWQADGAQGLVEDLEIFDRINALRASLGKPPYAWSHDLSVAARIHAEDMATHHFLGHIGTDGSTPGQRIDGTGLAGLAVQSLIIGENCAMGQETPREAVEAWIASPPHYAAMIHDKFTEIGIGVVADESGKMYWCTTFAGDDA